MNNLLLYFGGFLIVVLAALFGVPYAVDWNSYRGVFEEEASRMLGREVRVQGNVAVRLLPTPYVHAEKLRIGGAVGEETGRPFFRADGFTMWLSVPPLLKGIVEAREVDIVKPVLELAIDAEGRTSLASLKITPGRFSLMPQDIAFRSVNIVDGSLGLSGPEGVELARLEGLNGEISADTIDGPFRFRGTVKWDDEVRDVRMTTAEQDLNGELRFKAVITVPANQNSYTLEGAARDLTGVAGVDGTLTARISTAGFVVEAGEGRSLDSAAVSAGTQPPQAGSYFDLTAKIASEPGRIRLDDIAIALEQGGLPQLISGRSSLSWRDAMKIDLELNSKWLDLDRLTAGAATAPGAIPLETARTLFDRLVDQLPAMAQTNIAIAVDQVGLGKQSVSGLKLKASRSGGPLELKNVRAGLPGGTQLSLDGVVDGAAGARSFTGTMALSGQSLTRFTTWGFGDNPFSRQRSDGPFAIAGNLRLDDTAIELTDATADVSGTPVIGDVRLGLAEPRRLAVSLEGEKINLGDLWPGNPGLRGLRGLLTGGGTAEVEPAQPGKDAQQDGLFPSDVSFDIKAGQLIDGERMLQNVHLDVALQKGALTVPKLKFEAKGGLAVDLEGAAAGVPDQTRGRLRGVIEAATPEAVSALSDLVDLPAESHTRLTRWSSLTPWRMASTFSFGERLPGAFDVTLDGTLRGGRLVAEARIDSARGDWRTAPADIKAEIDTPDVYGFLDQISGSKSKVGAPRSGNVFVKAAGKAAEGLVAVVELRAETVEMEFNGRVAVPESGDPTAKGEIRIAADDLGRVMTLAGLKIGAGAGPIPVSGTVATAHDGNKLTLASPALTIGDAAVSGVVTYTAGTDGKPATVEADLSADKASLPGLVSALSSAPVSRAEAPVELPAIPSRRRREEPEAVASVPPPRIWPEQAFDFSPLNGVSGTVKAGVRALSLEQGLAMKDARFDVVFAPGKLDVTRLEGAVLGGKAVSNFTIEKQPAGGSLNGKLSISVSSKGSAESDGDDAIEADVAALGIAFSGRALSPAAMIAALSGKGALTLGDVSLSGVAPRGVADIADQALQSKGVLSGDPLNAAVRASLQATQLKLGKVTIPVTVGDGLMKLDRVQVDTAEGRATFDTMLDLQTLMVDSTWKIEAKGYTRAQPSVEGAATAGIEPVAGVPAPIPVSRSLLPPVSVVYFGRLADLGSDPPSIETSALERELAVRRMERDVDELERLRKLDEDRARKERERQQAIDAERERRQRELEQKLLPQEIEPPAAEPTPVPVDGSATIDPAAAAAAAAAAAEAAASSPPVDSAPAPRPRVQAQPQPKKKPPSTWQPFQMSPYQ